MEEFRRNFNFTLFYFIFDAMIPLRKYLEEKVNIMVDLKEETNFEAIILYFILFMM
jgi:hypothetical protein